jgi:hypothetical protein
MRVSFACPSCGAGGSAEESFVGRPVRCRHCGHRFAIPAPGETASEVYDLETPPPTVDPRPAPGPVFVPSRGDQTDAASTFRAVPGSRTKPARRSTRVERSRLPWLRWLAGLAIAAAVLLAVTAVVAPRGPVIVATILMGLGSLMALVGWLVGAYASFREDFVYGVLYVAVPLYTAYYLVTRWDDLWPWFACSMAGLGLVLIGTEMLRSSGALI